MRLRLELDYLLGYLQNGHFECDVPLKHQEMVAKMTHQERKRYIIENGDIILDDYSLEDWAADCNEVEIVGGD